MKRCAGIAALALAIGCGTFVPVVDVSSLSAQQRRDMLEIEILPLETKPDRPFRILGAIEAYSCKHWIWDPPASRSNALEQLRYRAFELGATAIVEVTFDISVIVAPH